MIIRSLAGLIFVAILLTMATTPASSAPCPTDCVVMDPSEYDNYFVMFAGHAIGQTFVASDTLIESITLYRREQTNYVGWKLYLTETNSLGRPDAGKILLDSNTLFNFYGDGVHPVPFTFTFDPPLALPHRGTFCFAVQGDPCDGSSRVFARSNPYADGVAWDFTRSACYLMPFPTQYAEYDLAFTMVYCGQTTAIRGSTWGQLKAVYR